MKSLFLTALSLFAGHAMAAAINTAEFYQLDGWPGEYPAGYEILKDFEVNSVESPVNPMPQAGVCTLPAKAVIHPWAQKTKSEFVTLFPVSRYQVVKDYSVQSGNATLAIKTGDEVIELSYLSEGICILEYKGTQFEDDCLGNGGDDRAKLISRSAFAERQFFKTACKEGQQAWIDAKDLNEAMGYDPQSVQAAEITDYGSVKEP